MNIDLRHGHGYDWHFRDYDDSPKVRRPPANSDTATETPTAEVSKHDSKAIIAPIMPLPSGTKLGPYEITTPLGAGGMGEVYRARDTRPERSVAIKILPDSSRGSNSQAAV